MARESKYKERLLIKEFKKEMNKVIRQKLMELEYFLEVSSSGMKKQQIWIGIERRVEEKRKD